MIYAELVDDYRIVDKGVFLSMAEFLDYRAKGWSSAPDIDAEADARLRKLKETPESVLKYMAPMMVAGRESRDELARRRDMMNPVSHNA